VFFHSSRSGHPHRTTLQGATSEFFDRPLLPNHPAWPKPANRPHLSSRPTRRHRTTTGTSARWQAQQEATSVFFHRSRLRLPTTPPHPPPPPPPPHPPPPPPP